MKLISYITLLLVILLTTRSYATDKNSNIEDKDRFSQLDSILAIQHQYEIKIDKEISELEVKYNLESDLVKQYQLTEQLQNHYLTYNHDSAVVKAVKMLDIAYQLNDNRKIVDAKIASTNTFLAAGIFGEAKDIITSIDTAKLDPDQRAIYLYTYSQIYYSLAEYYINSSITSKYYNSARDYNEEALKYCKENSILYYEIQGMLYLVDKQFEKAEQNYKELFNNHSIKGRKYAVIASTYAYILENLKRDQQCDYWLIQAAIQDIKIANKENIATRRLAERLFNRGDIERSSRLLKIAKADAENYGALHRRLQISHIQPIVEQAKLELVEEKNRQARIFAIVVSILTLIIIIFLIILLKQIKKIRDAQNSVTRSNEALKEVNSRLREVNLIKEEYIGYFFNTNTEFIEKIDDYRQKIENRIVLKKYKELSTLITKGDIKRERTLLYQRFDDAFLNIFPNFIDRYNTLFNKEDQYIPEVSKHLNGDLRIFALIRLGISNSETIAHILNYSVNTVNSYKTKIKNRSIVSNEEFEKHILNIQSV